MRHAPLRRLAATFASVASGAMLVAALAPQARAAVSRPHPGLVLVTQPGSALVIADLCAVGVSVRATKYAERRATPEGWAAPLGLAAAVNADFFDFPNATQVQGRARGGGEDWPANRQNVEAGMGEVRQYFQFGPRLAALVQPSTAAPAPGATEIIGAHNLLVRNGASLGPGFDGDAVLAGAFRRTAVGLSKDRAKLFLFSSNNTLTGAQLVAALVAHAAEGGGPAIDVAANLDGGGSSQLYVRDQGQLVTSGRLVANHLGVFARGSGDAPMCPSRAPVGNLDAADCTHITGWAQDPDVPTESIGVTLAFDSIFPDPKARYADAQADVDRPDVGAVVGSSNHGFDLPTPFALFDGLEHPLVAIGKDREGLRSAFLVGTQKVRCVAAPPPSLRRALTQATFDAWRFSAFQDVMPLADAALAALKEGPALGSAPALVRADDGSPEVWLVDEGARRHVPSPAVARAWHLDLGATTTRPAASVAGLRQGPPLRSRPTLARGAGSALYLLDALPDEARPDAGVATDGGVAGTDAGASPSDPGGARIAGLTPQESEGCALGARGASSTAPWVLVAGLAAGIVRRARRGRRSAR